MSTTHQTQLQGMPYVQLTFRSASGRRRTVWALQESPRRFWRADEEGGFWERETSKAVQRELIIAAAGDIIAVEPAGLNLHYGVLEVL